MSVNWDSYWRHRGKDDLEGTQRAQTEHTASNTKPDPSHSERYSVSEIIIMIHRMSRNNGYPSQQTSFSCDEEYLQRRMEILKKKREEIIKKGLNKGGRGCITDGSKSNISNKYTDNSQKILEHTPDQDCSSIWTRVEKTVCKGYETRDPCGAIGSYKNDFGGRPETKNRSIQANEPKPIWMAPFDRLREYICPKDREYQSSINRNRNECYPQNLQRELSDSAISNLPNDGRLCEKIIVFKKYKRNKSDAGASGTSDSSKFRDFEHEEETSFQEKEMYPRRKFRDCQQEAEMSFQEREIYPRRKPTLCVRESETQTYNDPPVNPDCGCPIDDELVADSGPLVAGSGSPVSIKVFVGRKGGGGRGYQQTPLEQFEGSSGASRKFGNRQPLSYCRRIPPQELKQGSVSTYTISSSDAPCKSKVKSTPGFNTPPQEPHPVTPTSKPSSRVFSREKPPESTNSPYLSRVNSASNPREVSPNPSFVEIEATASSKSSRKASIVAFAEGHRKSQSSAPNTESEIEVHPSQLFKRVSVPEKKESLNNKDTELVESEAETEPESEAVPKSKTKDRSKKKKKDKDGSKSKKKKSKKEKSKPSDTDASSVENIESTSFAQNKQTGLAGSRSFRVPCETYKRSQFVLPGPINHGRLRHFSRVSRHRDPSVNSVSSCPYIDQSDLMSSPPVMDYNSTRSSRHNNMSRKSSIKVLHKTLWGI